MRIGIWFVAQPELRVAAADQGADLGTEPSPEPQVDPRIRVTEPSQPVSQLGAGKRAHQCQRDRAPAGAAHSGHRLEPVGYRREERLGVREERPAGISHDDAAVHPLEQRRAQLVLEELDAAAERGLREVEAGRRPGESPQPGDHQER